MSETPVVTLTARDIDDIEQQLTGVSLSHAMIPMLHWITRTRRIMSRRRASAGLPKLDRVEFWNLYVSRTGPLAYAESREHPDGEVWAAIRQILTRRTVQSVDTDIAAEREALARRLEGSSPASEIWAAASPAVEPVGEVGSSTTAAQPRSPESPAVSEAWIRLMERELRRRADSKDPPLGSSIDQDSAGLRDWYIAHHPPPPPRKPPAEKTIKNKLREFHRKLRESQSSK